MSASPAVEREAKATIVHTPLAQQTRQALSVPPSPRRDKSVPKMSVPLRRHGALHPVMPSMVMNRNCVTPYHERPNCVISPFLDPEMYSRASNAAFIWSRTPARG